MFRAENFKYKEYLREKTLVKLFYIVRNALISLFFSQENYQLFIFALFVAYNSLAVHLQVGIKVLQEDKHILRKVLDNTCIFPYSLR